MSEESTMREALEKFNELVDSNFQGISQEAAKLVPNKTPVSTYKPLFDYLGDSHSLVKSKMMRILVEVTNIAKASEEAAMKDNIVKDIKEAKGKK